MSGISKTGLRRFDLRAVLVLSLAALSTIVASPPASAQDINAAVLRIDYPSLLPLSRLDLPAENRGFAGARLATDDNRTTGQFMGQTYATKEVHVTPDKAVESFRALMDEGTRLVVVIADSADLLAMADAAPSDALLLNAASGDTTLRSAQCRANVLHVAPSDAMRTDAVAQFLVWKRWDDWFLI